MPPDRNTPSGTSLIRRSRIDSSSSSRNRRTSSATVAMPAAASRLARRHIPIAPADDLAALERQDVSGQQLVDPLEHRLAAGERPRAEQFGNRGLVGARRRSRPLARMPFDLRREEQPLAAARPVERLDAQPIARERAAGAGGHPRSRTRTCRAGDRRRRRPIARRRGRCSRYPIACDRRGRSASSSRRRSAVVVDLAVEADPDRLVFVGERLLAGGQIDDAQSAVAEGRTARRRTAPHRPDRDGPARRASPRRGGGRLATAS